MPIPCFTSAQLESLAKVLGDLATGSEISRLLATVGLPDPNPAGTKWRRLLEIFSQSQAQYRVGNHVGAFIQAAMEPARFHDAHDNFEVARDSLNVILVLAGLELGRDGRLRAGQTARTLDEARERAGRLRAELERRRVHPDVLRFCRAELLDKNYFHAVLEATKSVADKLRDRSGLTTDGALLIDQALGGDEAVLPQLAFNSLQTPTEWSEHRGFMNLMKGLFGAFRNPTAHAPKISWAIGEQDALDLLTLASLLHRRLDSSVRTGCPSSP